MIRFSDWFGYFVEMVEFVATQRNLILHVDRKVASEVHLAAKRTLNHFGDPKAANQGKIAGSLCFWIKKLKPVSHMSNSPERMPTVNEVCGVLLAFSICEVNIEIEELEKDFFVDFVRSLRSHIHSPQSLAFIFQLIADPPIGERKQ